MGPREALVGAWVGAAVKVIEDRGRPEFVGKRGLVQKSIGSPEHAALDVRFEGGRLELFWFHQLERTEGDRSRPAGPAEERYGYNAPACAGKQPMRRWGLGLHRDRRADRGKRRTPIAGEVA